VDVTVEESGQDGPIRDIDRLVAIEYGDRVK
jgi:hypothetical protein